MNMIMSNLFFLYLKQHLWDGGKTVVGGGGPADTRGNINHSTSLSHTS